MKVYFLDYGWLEGDINWMVTLKNYATKSNKTINSVWTKFPEYGILIEHDGEYILYDTGSNYADYDRSERFPYYFKDDQGVIQQLKLLGLTPDDIHTVILSHLHDDHCGNLDYFKHADMYIDKDEYEYVIKAQQGLLPLRGAYKQFKNSYDRIHLVDSEYEFIKGIKLYRLPGHSHGLLGLMIELKETNLFVVSDAIDTEENYLPTFKASSGLYNEEMYFETLERIKLIQQHTNATVIYGHDYAQFSALKKCPYYYE